MTTESHPVHVTVLRLYLDAPFRGNGGDLRRAITAALPDRPLLHHHDENGKSEYSVSQVRYLVLNNIPHLVSFQDGRKSFDEVTKLKNLRTPNTLYQVLECDFIEDGLEVGTCDHLITYESRTPWLALNQENSAKFQKLNRSEKKALLNSILIGNYLSLSKGLQITIRSRLLSEIIEYHTTKVRAPTPMTGIYVRFVSNFLLSEFLGLGKMPSKGFGLMQSTK